MSKVKNIVKYMISEHENLRSKWSIRIKGFNLPVQYDIDIIDELYVEIRKYINTVNGFNQW